MDTNLATVIVSTSGSVIVGLGGMWIATNQLGKRVDRLETTFDRLREEIKRDIEKVDTKIERLAEELKVFKELVNSKFAALDLEIAKLLDKNK